MFSSSFVAKDPPPRPSEAASCLVHYVAHIRLCFLAGRLTREYMKFRILFVSDSYIVLN